MKLTPREAMLMAIEEARKGAGFVSPNPLVGCVIVDRHHHFLSKGFHQRYGEAHAEINALAAVKDPAQLNGAHVFVTLEPCAHEGKTGSCAKALAKLPLASVTYGLEDPFPLVSGKGARIVEAAGIKTEIFAGLKTELEELAEIFLLNQRRKRPFVALKVASSLDGQIAMADGSSQWITGEKSREHTHYLRGCYDAVLAGAGTILKDNPRMNSRHPAFAKKPQRLVILDPSGRAAARLSGSALSEARAPEDIFWVTRPGVAPEDPRVSHLQLNSGGQGFDLNELLGKLWEKGIRSLFIEGGAHTYAGFLHAGLVDRLYLFIAPRLLGQGLGWTKDLKIPDLSSSLNLTQGQFQALGEDWLFTAKPADSIT